MRLKVVAHIGLLASLQLTHVRCILLARVVQLTALAEHLKVHGQRSCLHVHQLVIGDGGLAGGGGDVTSEAVARPVATPISTSPSHSSTPCLKGTDPPPAL